MSRRVLSILIAGIISILIGASPVIAKPKIPNVVTVAPKQADYADPADAADNAFSGDNWCDPVLGGCKINVLAGAYTVDRTINLYDGTGHEVTLEGAGSDKTKIIAGLGVDVAVVGSSVSSLSIINTEPSVNQKIGLLESDNETGAGGSDLRIEVGGGMTNIGVRVDSPNNLHLADSYIRISGGFNSIGVFGSWITLVDVEISLVAGQSASGVTNWDDEGGGLDITRSIITAFGTDVTAVTAHGAGGRIMDSTLWGNGDGAEGLNADCRDGCIRLISSDVRGTGSGSIGAWIIALAFETFRIDRATISGETAMVINDGDSGADWELILSNSSVNGNQVAMAFRNSGSPRGMIVKIDGSFVQAPIAIDAEANFDVSFGASKIDGTINQGTSAFKCVFTYDGDYQPLDSACQ